MESITRWLLVFCILCLFNHGAQAQTGDELFNQKKTQLRYLAEQIAALRVYAGYVKDGYEIVSDGVQTVESLKNGEFDVHNAFFKSLKAVNPSISNSGKAVDIVSLQLAINKSLNGIKGLRYLSVSQRNYITRVKNQVLKECNNDLEELLLVVTSGQLEMTDDERIKRIDKIYAAMSDKWSFAQSFLNELSMLVYQKKKEEQSIIHIKNLYEND
jgi:hypothetical protein